MQLPDSPTPRLPDSLPAMTDVPKNLSFLTPTSVINLVDSISYLVHTHPPNSVVVVSVVAPREAPIGYTDTGFI